MGGGGGGASSQQQQSSKTGLPNDDDDDDDDDDGNEDDEDDDDDEGHADIRMIQVGSEEEGGWWLDVIEALIIEGQVALFILIIDKFHHKDHNDHLHDGLK